jgi:hypothetical protein
MVTSRSHARHLKCIMAPMKAVALLLLIAVSVQAQTLAEIARQERARQAKSKPTRIITSHGTITPEEPKAAAPDVKAAVPGAAAPQTAKPEAPETPDPIQAWNKELDQLRAKVRELQDQEMALILQQNQATNQVYAPVTDPATQQKAIAQLGQVQLQLETVRKDLDEAWKALEALQLQGPKK